MTKGIFAYWFAMLGFTSLAWNSSVFGDTVGNTGAEVVSFPHHSPLNLNPKSNPRSCTLVFSLAKGSSDGLSGVPIDGLRGDRNNKLTREELYELITNQKISFKDVARMSADVNDSVSQSLSGQDSEKRIPSLYFGIDVTGQIPRNGNSVVQMLKDLVANHELEASEVERESKFKIALAKFSYEKQMRTGLMQVVSNKGLVLLEIVYVISAHGSEKQMGLLRSGLSNSPPIYFHTENVFFELMRMLKSEEIPILASLLSSKTTEMGPMNSIHIFEFGSGDSSQEGGHDEVSPADLIPYASLLVQNDFGHVELTMTLFQFSYGFFGGEKTKFSSRRWDLSKLSQQDYLTLTRNRKDERNQYLKKTLLYKVQNGLRHYTEEDLNDGKINVPVRIQLTENRNLTETP